MKKIVSLMLVLLMVLVLFTGCSNGGEFDISDGRTIGLVISTLDNPFFVDLQTGAQEKADELGAKLVVLDSQDDPAKEMSNVEDLISQGVSAIMINPTDSDAVAGAIQAANKALIPVVTLDRAEGLSVMENILQSQASIDAVFAHNDEMALGALEAIKASGRDIMVVGFDATDDAKAAVANGKMAATVEQLPKQIGSLGVNTVFKYLMQEDVDTIIPVPLQLVTE